MSTHDPIDKPLAPRPPELSAAARPAPGRDLPEDGEVIRPAQFEPLSGPVKRRRATLRPVYFYAGAALLLLVGIAAYLFSAKSVTIITEPPVAEVSVSGGFSFALGDNRLMHSGEYAVTATAPGYKVLQQPLTVGEEQNQTFRLELVKLPGVLTVTAAVNEIGEVYLDGELVGGLNQPIQNVPPGAHQVHIITERYRPHSTRVEIEGKGLAQTLDVSLEPAWAEVNIESVPAGAEVLVDGEVIGITPTAAQILEGERDLRLRLPGFKSWRETRDLEAGQTINLGKIELAKADGLVWVDSTPAQASITINGEYKGRTPMEVALAPGGEYQVTLFKDGFQPAQRTVAVKSGVTEKLKVQLQAKLGQINISALPADALLYVNGRLMGRANQTLTLPAAQTQVTIKKEGFADYTTTVLPRPGLAQSVEARLKTLEEVRWENIKPVITTNAGQQLKLFKPEATFTMGSSRREQGRRANESLHDVSLSRPFYLGVHEVTNAQYRQFKRDHSSSHVKGQSLDGNDYPVVNVNWQAAALYCNWLSEQENLPPFYNLEAGVVTGFNPQSTGYRLPTEAEWAWAARFENGEMLKYPWQGELPPPEKTANIADRAAAPVAGYIQPDYLDGFAVSAPVGSFPPNPKGIFDLAGNVAEWVNDFYEIPGGLSTKATPDPLGPSEGQYHVIRGSSWAHGAVTELRLSFRDYGTEGRDDLGFRIARFVEQ